MSTVAILTARGGSKRIPRKNIRDFLGKPMIAYPLQAALQSGETPFVRPMELADDHTGTMPIVRHALRWLLDNGERVEYACCIYPTAPFLTPELLAQAFQSLKQQDKDFAFSVGRFSYPIQRALKRTDNGGVEPFTPEFIPCRSQDLEPAYHDAGQFYWGTTEAFLAGRPIFSDAALPVVLPDHMVQDIDNEEDWIRAEFMYQAQRLAGTKHQ